MEKKPRPTSVALRQTDSNIPRLIDKGKDIVGGFSKEQLIDLIALLLGRIGSIIDGREIVDKLALTNYLHDLLPEDFRTEMPLYNSIHSDDVMEYLIKEGRIHYV